MSNGGAQLRVEIFPDAKGEKISVTEFMAGDGEPKYFNDVTDLPLDMQEKLAVLMVMGQGKRVTGVGEQVLLHVFWIDKPTG